MKYETDLKVTPVRSAFGVLLEFVEGAVQFLVRGGMQSVHALGPLNGDLGDRPLAIDVDELVAHGSLLGSVAVKAALYAGL